MIGASALRGSLPNRKKWLVTVNFARGRALFPSALRLINKIKQVAAYP